MIHNPKHLQLEFISIYKPVFNKIKGICDKKKLLLSNNINLFRKSCYDFEQKKLKIEKETVLNPFQENEDNFIEKYRIFKKKVDDKYFANKEMLGNIRYELDKKDHKYSKINFYKNLFNKNLLFSKKKNINNRILSFDNNNNSNNVLNSNYDENDMKNFNSKSNNYFFENSKLIKDKSINSKSEILDHQKEIENINKTLQTLKNIDEFLDGNQNSKLLNDRGKKTLNNFHINKTILKSQFNKTFYDLPKSSLNRSLPPMDGGTNKIFNSKKLNKSFTLGNTKNNISTKIKQKKNIFYRNKNQNNEISLNEEILYSNVSDHSMMNEKELIKIKKIILNKKDTQKNIKTIDSRMSTLYPNTSYNKYFHKKNTNIKPIKIQKLLKTTSVPNIFDNKKEKEVELIYETLRNSEDSMIYYNFIKNHIKNKTKINEHAIKNISANDIFLNYF